MQQFTHYFLHFVFPVIIAFLFFREKGIKVSAIFLLTMLVDADHLLANPIFEACRCSIGFHPLHSYPAIMLYVIGLVPNRTRIVAIGLLMHMATDQIDCIWNFGNCL